MGHLRPCHTTIHGMPCGPRRPPGIFQCSEACNVIPGGAVVRLAYHAWWYGMGVGALQACSGPKMGCVAKHSKGRYASCDEHRSHTRGHSEERDQKSGVLWHENEKIQPPQFGRASGQTRDLGDIGYSARPRPFQAVPFISSVRCRT